MTSAKPERWEELCHDIGLALLLGQKVQFALAHYFGVHQGVRAGWNKSQIKEKIRFFLSKPMGVVVAEIKKSAPLPGALSTDVDTFKTDRNWLVHDFDEESTPYIFKGERIDHYISRMEQISRDAQRIMVELDKIGDDLMKEKGVDPSAIKKIAEDRLKTG
ncbi:MAG: hypothetical protein JRI71_15820 [Deltaproteobacteria bacterium]|nr:hypothetical protein [Deltaproteobacteria bacterium]